jgi:hypothetical protein
MAAFAHAGPPEMAWHLPERYVSASIPFPSSRTFHTRLVLLAMTRKR